MKERDIFIDALQIDSPGDRAAFLATACAGDAGLRQRVERLLLEHQRQESFLLDAPPPAVVATVTERPLTEKPGDTIGPYKLLEKIGEGGFGVVFMAEQTAPVKRKVALKVIKPGMDTKEVIARFEAERQALALMDHPNIAKVLDAGATETGRPFFVMELVRGVPITEFCDQAQLTPRQRLELFVSVCQAVQHAHQKGIIHRDIKPTNVLVTQHDDKPLVKVIDFGIAKATSGQLTDKTLFTAFAQFVGTPLYMSPEQAALSAIDIDTRSDIYSLGVLLYELLTGTTPFDKTRLQQAAFEEVRRIIREEEPQKPSTRLSSLGATLPSVSAVRKTEPRRLSQLVRGDLDWIVMKALEKDRSRRYETANGFAADVLHFLADEPVTACPPSATYRLRKFARRNKAGLTMTAVVGLALLVVVGSLGWMVRDRAAREHEFALQQQEQRESLDREVNAALDEAERLGAQEKWDEAIGAAQRVEQLLSAAGRADRPPRLLVLKNDLAMAQRLEEIYRHPERDSLPLPPPAMLELVLTDSGRDAQSVSTIVSGSLTPDESKEEEEIFAGREQDARFTAAFQEYGIDVDALDVAGAAARVRQTTIRGALVKALDDWAAMRRRARGEQDTAWKKLVEVARSADQDEWRNQFREALLARDRPALEKLASELSPGAAPPATLLLLADILKQLGALEQGLSVLVRAQQHFPDDLWINDALASMCETDCRPRRYADALRFYSIASALRPRAPRWHKALERAHFDVLFPTPDQTIDDQASRQLIAESSRVIDLQPDDPRGWIWRAYCHHRLEQWDEAVADYSKAIELQPDNAEAWWRLGLCYRDSRQWAHDNPGVAREDEGQLDQAITCIRKAVELDPKNSRMQGDLGLVLQDKGLLDEAVACYCQAIEFDPKFASAQNNLGNALRDQRKLDEAIECYHKAIELDSNYAPAYNNLGVALKDQGKLDEAVECYRKAIELDPNFAAAHNNLGVILSERGQLDEAIACYRKAIELDPKNASAHSNLGTALANQGKLDEAIDCYRKAIELDPKCALAHSGLGVVRCDFQRDYEAAVGSFRKAVEFAPEVAGYHFNLGRALMELGKLDEAVACYRKAIELKPAYAEAYNNLGACLTAQNRLDEATACFRKNLELQPNDAVVHKNLGVILAANGQLDEAITCFRKAIELDPQIADAYNSLGAILCDVRHDYEAAAAAFQKAAELQPECAQFHFNLGNALGHQGKLDEAIACYHRAIELDPRSAKAYTNLGIALRELGKLEEAVVSFHKAIEVNPEFAQAYSNLGEVLLRQGKNDDAIPFCHKAIELDPKDVTSINNLGVAQRDLGKLDEAAVSFGKAIEVDPEYVLAYSNLGDVLLKQNKPDEAIACYRKAIELDPKVSDNHNQLGIILCDVQRDYEAAAAAFRSAIALEPGRAAFHFNLGNALTNQEKLDGAIASYRKAVELDPKYVNAYFGLGNTLAASGQLDAAIACYRKTIELNPKYATAWANLGYAQYLSEQYLEAVASLEKAKELAGAQFSTAGSFFLVMAYWRSGNEEAARNCYAETVARDNTPCPERTEAEQLLGIGQPESKPNPDEPKPDKPAPPDGANE